MEEVTGNVIQVDNLEDLSQDYTEAQVGGTEYILECDTNILFKVVK